MAAIPDPHTIAPVPPSACAITLSNAWALGLPCLAYTNANPSSCIGVVSNALSRACALSCNYVVVAKKKVLYPHPLPPTMHTYRSREASRERQAYQDERKKMLLPLLTPSQPAYL